MRRKAIAVVLWIVAVLVAYEYAWLPIVASRGVTRLSDATDVAYNLPPYRAASVARANSNDARRLLVKAPDNVSLAMIAAANEELLGNNDSALALYRDAVKRERRPELLLNLGLLEARTGDRANALIHLGDAVMFDPKVMHRVNDPEILVALNRVEEKRYASKPNLLHNSDFSRAALGGSTATLTTMPGHTAGAASAAANWTTYNNAPGTTTTTRLPSTRRPGGTMMRVTTSGAYNGIVQVWGDPDVGPPSARSSVWLFIRRGSVFIGTGNASAAPDAQTSETGRWIQISGVLTGTCPANQTQIFAVGSEGADFDIDSPVVAVNPGGYCAAP
jgi:hypothetical protein